MQKRVFESLVIRVNLLAAQLFFEILMVPFKIGLFLAVTERRWWEGREGGRCNYCRSTDK